MLKMHFALINAPRRLITEKVDEIMEKVEQDRYISSYDIGKDIEYYKILYIIQYNIIQNSIKSFGAGWIQKNLDIRCHMI